MNKDSEIVITIKCYFDYFDSKTYPGRSRTLWVNNLRQLYAQSSMKLFQVAVNKTRLGNMIANMIAKYY